MRSLFAFKGGPKNRPSNTTGIRWWIILSSILHQCYMNAITDKRLVYMLSQWRKESV